MDEHKTCCFIGHREFEITDELVCALRRIIEMLICEENVLTFVFGSRSLFNDLCHKIVTQIKSEYPIIKRVIMTCKHEACILESEREREEQIFQNVLKQKVHLRGFEEELSFKNKNLAGRASYIERNQAMIDISEFCVFYFDENYAPRNRKYCHAKSGTALAYKYAQRRKKHIINMFGYEKIS